MDFIEELPDHPYNNTLIEHAAPRDWVNPTPQDEYHLVVIGGGSAGLVATSAAAQLGARVAIIEKSVLGGDCLNVGCVPSKAIIKAGKIAADMRKGAKFGVSVPADQITVDFAKVMEHVWSARAHIAPHDSAKRFTDLGADVFFGTGTFIDGNTIDVDGQKLTFRKALIATGSGPRHIPIPGLADVGYLTNESLWNVTTQPESLAVIGAGPIGAELAQAFQRLGTQVTLIDIAPQMLIREDPDAAAIVQNALVSDGVNLCLGASTKQVSAQNGKKVLEIEKDGAAITVVVDEIVLAVGRAPNLNGLNLEAAGVEYTKRGVTVDDTLRTTNKNVYAAGDVAMKYQFTHAAGHAAGIVIQNALFPNPKKLKVSDLIMPWATYTDPEVAHVGLYEKDAAEQGIEIDTYTVHMDENDRAVADGESEGFVKIHTAKGKDTILGATIVSRHAGDLLTELTGAMKNKIGLAALGGVIRPYPTQSELIGKAATAYNKTRLTPTTAKVLKALLR